MGSSPTLYRHEISAIVELHPTKYLQPSNSANKWQTARAKSRCYYKFPCNSMFRESHLPNIKLCYRITYLVPESLPFKCY
jgi:hypothetical protein